MALKDYNKIVVCSICFIIIILSCKVSNQVNNFNNRNIYKLNVDTLNVEGKGLIAFEIINIDTLSYSFDNFNKIGNIYNYKNTFIHKNSDRPIGVPMIDRYRIHTIVHNKDTMIIRQECGIGINLYFKIRFIKGKYKIVINELFYKEKFITGNEILRNEDLKKLYIKNSINPNLENNYSNEILDRYFENLSFRVIDLQDKGVTLIKEIESSH